MMEKGHRVGGVAGGEQTWRQSQFCHPRNAPVANYSHIEEQVLFLDNLDFPLFYVVSLYH